MSEQRKGGDVHAGLYVRSDGHLSNSLPNGAVTGESHPVEQHAPSLRSLIAQWRKEAEHIKTYHATMHLGFGACADDLEAALAAQLARLADLEAEMRRFAEAHRSSLGYSAPARQTLAWAERLKALYE